MKKMKVYTGIFWVVDGEIIYDKLKIDVDEKNRYTDYPKSHFDMWDELKKWHYGSEKISIQGDFCTYPRGRIMYDSEYEKYIIYTDKCITDEQIFRIKEDFDQFDGYVAKVFFDEHYQCDKCIADYKIEETELLEKVKKKWPVVVELVEDVLNEKAVIEVEKIVLTKSSKMLAYIDRINKKLAISNRFIFLPDNALLHILIHEAIHIMPSCFNTAHGKEFKKAFQEVQEDIGESLMSDKKLYFLYCQAKEAYSLSLIPKHLYWIKNTYGARYLNDLNDIGLAPKNCTSRNVSKYMI